MKKLFLGDDIISLHSHKETLKKSFLERCPNGSVRIFSFSADKNSVLQEVLQNLLPGFFPLPELFILEDAFFLEKNQREELVEVLKRKSSEKECVIFEYQNIPQKDSYWKSIKSLHVEVVRCQKKERNIEALLEEIWQRFGGISLPPNTIREIRQRVSDDQEFLSRVETVLTYSGGKIVSQEELERLIPVSLEAEIFKVLDLLAADQKKKALEQFHILLDQDDIFRIFGMCAWQIRQMIAVADCVQRSIPGGNIATVTKIHPFVVQKIQKVLPRFPKKRLVKGIALLATLDQNLKTSTITSEGALDRFILHF